MGWPRARVVAVLADLGGLLSTEQLVGAMLTWEEDLVRE